MCRAAVAMAKALKPKPGLIKIKGRVAGVVHIDIALLEICL